jgi:hypothetical protein
MPEEPYAKKEYQSLAEYKLMGVLTNGKVIVQK